MQLLQRVLSDFRSRPKRHLGLAFIAVSNHITVVVLAATPTVLAVPVFNPTQSSCSVESCINAVAVESDARLSLPAGHPKCQESGPAAACKMGATAADSVPGTPAVPVGQSACPSTDVKPVPTTPATCSDTLLPPITPARSSGDATLIVVPSVPGGSLGVRLPSRLQLTATSDTLHSGGQVVLTATANASISATGAAIEIFDTTSGTLIAACGQGSQCAVGYTATSGVHDFVAFVTPPMASIPDEAIALRSNHRSVGWLGSTLTASAAIVGRDQAITITATSTIDVAQGGRWLEIYDLTAGSRITYCSRGTSCSTVVKETKGGVHQIVGYVTGEPEAVSSAISLTWLDVSLTASTIGPKVGGTVYLKAVINTDLTDTPWVVGIYDEQGHLVDHACKTGNTCSVQAWVPGTTTPRYTAVVGVLPEVKPEAKPAANSNVVQKAPAAPALVDIQAKSPAIEPTHLLWGVDSCKSFIGGGQNLYNAVVRSLGTPDFWGRYLTNTVCPGISSTEIALAASHSMGILPIYNDYNCSAVVYYAAGHQYAVEAAAAANRLGIPAGRLLAIDIEPPGAACPGAGGVDGGFIEGWHDGVKAAGYVPVFYGNGTAGTEFARAWCSAVARLPNLAADSALWSFEPSLLGGYNKAKAPGFAPYKPGCAGNVEAWQYMLSAGSSVDVDQDEALSTLPLWYP